MRTNPTSSNSHLLLDLDHTKYERCVWLIPELV